MNKLTDNLERFLEQERQETEVLTELAAALEVHCKAMTGLADALAQVRQALFGEDYHELA